MSTPIPTVNVNLRRCDCDGPHAGLTGAQSAHTVDCASSPVSIPCPIPRSVTMTVQLGECSCFVGNFDMDGDHSDDCHARPIRVVCSIRGKTWEESEVEDPEGHSDDGRLMGFAFASPVHAACRDRWAQVKALVTGGVPTTEYMGALCAQRDAVFAALAKAHLAEDALIEALGDYEEAMRGEPVGIYGLKRESHGALVRYIEVLIEQVGAPP